VKESFKGKLLAGVNQRIQLFKCVLNEDERELQEECNVNGFILNMKIRSRGDFFIVGDLMKSVSLYIYKEDEGAIELISQDFNQTWVSSCEMIDENTFIVCDNNYNIKTLTKNDESTDDEERKKLQTTGMYHLGSYVNKIINGSLKNYPIENEYSKIQTLVFGTIHGSIGIVARLPKKSFEFFEDVQQALRIVIKGTGGFSHSKFRSLPRTNEPSTQFIDGDLIESFLELNKSEMEKVVAKMENKVEVDQLTKMIEEIAVSLH
jgi:DNA damage-binding protein 1